MRIKTKECYYCFTRMTLLLVLLFVNQVAIRSQEQVSAYAPKDGEVYVVANGTGSSKENATYAALRSAIEQTFGTFVSSNTEILDDEVVRDEIISVSSGNVRHYEYISERTGADGTFYVTLRAIVSYAKLAAFVKSKGGAAELSLSNLAANFKIEQFYAENEKKVLENLAMQIEEFCLENSIYNYKIIVGEPKSISRQGDIKISYKVTPIINGNAAVVYDLFWNTIKGLAVQKPVDNLGLLQYGTTIMQGTKEFDRPDYYNVRARTLFKNIFRLYIKYDEFKHTKWKINQSCDCHFLVLDNLSLSKKDSLVLLTENPDHFIWKLVRGDRNAAIQEIQHTTNLKELEEIEDFLQNFLYPREGEMRKHRRLETIENDGEYSCDNINSFIPRIPRKKKKNTGMEDPEVIIEPALAIPTKYVQGNRMMYPFGSYSNGHYVGEGPTTLPFVLHYRVDHDIPLLEFRQRYLGGYNERYAYDGEIIYSLEELSKVTGLEVKPGNIYYFLSWDSVREIARDSLYECSKRIYILRNAK